VNTPANLNLTGHRPRRVITLEEHFTTHAFLKATRQFTAPVSTSDLLEQRLLDLGAGRIAAMDEGGIDLQVLSLAATGQESLDPDTATALVRDANDAAAEAVRRHSTRFAGFASLALKQPERAAGELERCVRSLGFVGGFVNGTEGGAFLDDPRFDPLFAAAQTLDVPLYLHPSPPSPVIQEAYFANLPERSAYFLSTAAWGWHAELGMHCLRLILGGVFDRFPRLRIIIGHMGENLPFSLIRAEDGLPASVTGLQRSVSEYFQDHFYVTTSGYFTLPPFLCAVQVLGIDRLLYSIDYPYRANTLGADFLRMLPVSPADLEKIAHANAEAILHLPVKTSTRPEERVLSGP
jgi:predicted TIM-barrel fold metal-dependent hydrolase